MNNLKHLFLVCILGAFIPFFFVSCSDSDSEDAQNTMTNDSTDIQTSDWLFLFYFDADNNLNDSIWANIHEAEEGLAELANGTNAPSVRCITLWDGVNNKKDGNVIEEFKYLTRIHPSSALLELGPSDKANSETNKEWFVSSNTKDLTNTDDVKAWLPAEPSMNDASTLTDFLSWAKKHYTAKNIVLTISDHGSGTDYETISGGASRSLCSDNDTKSGDALLTTTDIKHAIDLSGLPPHIIWLDCCLQASLEIAYDLRGYANSLVSSASISLSNYYKNVLGFLTTEDTYENFSQYVVSAYRLYYYDKAENSLRNDFLDAENRSSSFKALSQVGIDLDTKKQEALYKAVDALAESLLENDKENLTEIYNNYLYQNPKDETVCKGWVYTGTFAYLADLGYFCYQLKNDKSNVGVNQTTKDSAVDVDSALNAVIQSAWIGKRATGTDALFRYNVLWTREEADKKGSPSEYPLEAVEFGPDSTDSDSDKKNWGFGPTIAIGSVGTDATSGVFLNTGYSIVTGYSEKWGQVIKNWNSSN